MAGSNPGFDSLDWQGCLSTEDVLAHLDQRLDGQRLQNVRDHLDGCSACRVVMAEAARVATSFSEAPRTPRTLADGEIVAARYEVRRFVARGGMGEVYEAFDSALGETIALKTITVTAVDQADAVKRLLAEVRIARKVTHPNVCRILEFGTHHRAGSTDAPIPFLTMPLLQGETLGRRLQSLGRLRPRDALRILRELAAGLAAVHEVGVVHRDFKSDNVYLVRGDNGDERAVVMDFGLARALETQGDRPKTTGRVLIGTPAYMAPEQVEGKAITKAVDVYAFGVVAFEVITGRVPFVAASAAAVALARLQREAEPPSSLVPDVERGWDTVVQRCLKRVPEQRYRSMIELADALDRIGKGEPARRRRSAAALALGVAIVVLAGWGVVRPARRPAASQSIAGNMAPPAALGPTSLAPVVPPAPAVPADLAPKEPPRLKHERGLARARAKPAPRTASAPAVPSREDESPAAPVQAVQSALKTAPLDRPPTSRARQPDDLVDPF